MFELKSVAISMHSSMEWLPLTAENEKYARLWNLDFEFQRLILGPQTAEKRYLKDAILRSIPGCSWHWGISVVVCGWQPNGIQQEHTPCYVKKKKKQNRYPILILTDAIHREVIGDPFLAVIGLHDMKMQRCFFPWCLLKGNAAYYEV